jgi:peptidoglycan hydrolase CwlO-like protein
MKELQPVKRSADEEKGKLAKLEAELKSRDWELLELRESMSEKETHFKAVLERGAGDADELRAALREKQQQLESLKFTVAELQSEVAGLRALEDLAAEDKATIDRLTAEKELVRRSAREAVESIVKVELPMALLLLNFNLGLQI